MKEWEEGKIGSSSYLALCTQVSLRGSRSWLDSVKRKLTHFLSSNSFEEAKFTSVSARTQHRLRIDYHTSTPASHR